MSNEDDNGQLSLDDSSLAFVNDGTFGVDSMSDQSIQNDELTRSLLDPNSIWDFQGSPSFDTYDNTSADSTQPEYVTPSWQFPSLDELGSNSPANGGSNASPGIDPNGLFSPANFMMPPSENSGAARPRSTTTLTPAVHEKLKSIAMPAHFKYTSPNASSPDSNRSDTKAGIISSPDDTGAHQSRKRKVSSEPEDEEDDDDDDKPVKKTAHNMIEKRYRTNINDKIAALRDSVPSLRIMSKSARGEDTTVDREELHGLTPAHKLNKATVLSKATEYIRHLEKRNHRLLDENGAMQARIAAFEKLFMAGAMNGSIGPVQQPPSQMQYSQDGQQQFMGSPMPQQEGGEAPAGMIQVPDDMRRILAAQMAAGQPYPVPAQSFRGANPAVIRQQQIQQQQVQQQQQGNWSNASPYFGKLMVGSLAGLMILEAVREDEQSNENPDGRGLFAVPLQLLRSASSSLDLHIMGYHVHTSIKLLLFLGVFLWAFVPSLFRPSDDNPKKRNGAYLRAAPSLASSIEVRRQAWLTSIQTVWVPRHNFFLEAAALMLKTAKLSLRNIIGVHGYQALTGLTEEEETARVKAWSIALDSQLAGGDVDVCKSRLVLTLLASGTLPSTPQRLMLKALHIRVLLWDLSQSRMQLGLVNTIAAKLARTQWNEARQLNRLLIQLRDDSSAAKESELPEHLALLIERECDDVLTDSVIQRAHNLAFNRETSYDVAHPIDGMDAVVEDVYVSSPLDAVAAWWSTEVLHGVLTTALEKEAKTDVKNEDIETAIKAAPVGSVAMLRATLARAVLIKQERGASIASSLKALGSERIESPFRESKLVVGSGPHASNPDLLLTLRCAVAIGQLSRAEGAVVTPSQSLRVVEALLSPKMTADMTLLGFTSVMTLLEQVMQDKTEEAAFDRTLEKISGNLRIWIGGNAGTATGLDSDVRDKVVKRCLSITKTLVGMAVDSGHASMSDMSDADSID